jgi:hypothetical protein
MMTRRDITGLLLAPALQSQQPDHGALRDLELSPAVLQELVEESRRAVQQASLLRELPLDGVAPGFVFLAR